MNEEPHEVQRHVENTIISSNCLTAWVTTSIVRSVLQAPAGEELVSDAKTVETKTVIVILGFSHRGFGHVVLDCWFHSDHSEPPLAVPIVVSVVRPSRFGIAGKSSGTRAHFFC